MQVAHCVRRLRCSIVGWCGRDNAHIDHIESAISIPSSIRRGRTINRMGSRLHAKDFLRVPLRVFRRNLSGMFCRMPASWHGAEDARHFLVEVEEEGLKADSLVIVGEFGACEAAFMIGPAQTIPPPTPPCTAPPQQEAG